MSSGIDDDRGRPEDLADGMLEEARRSAIGESGEDGGGDLEPGVIADTGQPAGTADPRAAGVMDTDTDADSAAPAS